MEGFNLRGGGAGRWQFGYCPYVPGGHSISKKKNLLRLSNNKKKFIL